MDSKKAAKNYLQTQKRSTLITYSNAEIKANDEELIEERFLIELELPSCMVIVQGQTTVKPLLEEELQYLIFTGFKRWKNYLMTKLFRLELNIGQEKPLPKILEERDAEEDLISERDPREQFPVKAEEKQ